MGLVLYKFPETTQELKEDYPIAFDYLSSKGATVIALEAGHVKLMDNLGHCLKYDMEDIKIFNQLIKS